jgi:hypothetical protein
MKSLLLLLGLFILVMTSFEAKSKEIPKYLEGATVVVKLKNGKTYEYKSEKYAVVPRENLEINALKVAGFNKLHKKIVNKEIVKNKRNRVFGLLGQGPTGGLDVSTNGSRYKIEHDKGNVLGIGYQRKLNETINLGVQIQDNDTKSLSLGFDF